MTFSDRLKQLRKERKITQAELAFTLGMHERSFRGYEAGTVQPTLSVIIAIADYFNVSLDYLCGISDIRTRQ